MKHIEERFLQDALFANMVKTMEAYMGQLQLTPSEMREAVIYACIRFEFAHPRTFAFSNHSIFDRARFELYGEEK